MPWSGRCELEYLDTLGINNIRAMTSTRIGGHSDHDRVRSSVEINCLTIYIKFRLLEMPARMHSIYLDVE